MDPGSLSQSSLWGPQPIVGVVAIRTADDPGFAPSICARLNSQDALVLALADADVSPVILARCVEEGAAGIVRTTTKTAALADAIRALAEGASVLSYTDRLSLERTLADHRSDLRRRRRPFTRLTAREADVLSELVKGHHAEWIAEEFDVSVSTIRSQIRAVLVKLDCHSQLEAVALAHEARWGGPYDIINLDDDTMAFSGAA